MSAFDQGFNALEEVLLSISETNQMKVEQIVRQALRDFLSEFEDAIGAACSLQSSLATYGVKSWLEHFLHEGSARYATERILKRKLSDWIAGSSLRKLPELIDFCRRRCWNDLRSEALSAIAKRYKAIDREAAFNLLVEARQSTEFFFLHKKLARKLFDEAIALDPSRGIKLLFDSFREYHQRYPQNIIHSLDEIVRFHKEFPDTNFVELYQVWSGYNRTLAAGLSLKPVDVSFLQAPIPSTFIDSTLQYLVRMLDYPDVDVRLLSARACLNLLIDENLGAEALVEMWPQLNMTQKEHIVSILFSYALIQPEKVEAWVPELLNFVEAEVHFNLHRSTADLVFAVGATQDLPLAVYRHAEALTKRKVSSPQQGPAA